MTERISIDRLKRVVSYNHITGNLTWVERGIEDFLNPSRMNTWNTRFSGKPAVNNINKGGYKEGYILGRTYRAHQVAWAVHYGEWPKSGIDHINGDRLDNRISNLRLVSVQENQRNAKRRIDNTSGATGVRLHKKSGRWNARIAVMGKDISLGMFSCIDDAIKARKLAEVKYGFHENHGRRKND